MASLAPSPGRLLDIAISLYLGFDFWPSEIFIFGANDNPQFFVALRDFLLLVLTNRAGGLLTTPSGYVFYII